jgi:hypothetical protein
VDRGQDQVKIRIVKVAWDKKDVEVVEDVA